jgi:hypothetical protein
MRIQRSLAAALVAAGSAACSDSPSSSPPPTGFVVSGTIQNNTGAPIPSNTRVLVAWTVTSGSPDYSYVFGEGTFDPAAGTFEIELDQSPPAAALNTGQLGVGVVFATTNQAVAAGVQVGDTLLAGLVGVAGRYGIIYLGDPPAASPDWATEFPSGYSVGVGVDVEDDFDRFEPASASSVVLIIDDLANIDIVDWT